MDALFSQAPIAYRVDDACRALGLGRTRLYALIAEGKLDARACGGRTLVSADSLRSFLASLPPAQVRSRPGTQSVAA